MPSFFKLLSRFRKDERGVFGVIFGLIAVVLVALAGCVVDFSYMQTIRSRSQTALDAAALALQADMSTLTNDQIKTQAQALLRERLADNTVTAEIINVTKNVSAGTLNLQAHIRVPTIFVQLVGVRNLDAVLVSEVTQNSSNLEVSLALDLTQSMTEQTSGGRNAPTKIAALKDATDNMIDLLVQDTQPPIAQTYTRMAMAPYSYGVNVSYATNTDGTHTYIRKVRGTPKGTTSITGAVWKTSPAVTSTLSKIAKKSSSNTQAVVTANSVSSLSAGNWVVITGLPNGSPISNNTPYQLGTVSTSAKTFELVGITVSGTTNFTNVSFNKCLNASCEVTVTSANHGLSTGNQVYITGVNGMTQINNSGMTSPWTVGTTTSSTFILTGSNGSTYGTYSNSGTAQCLEYGCADLYIPGKSYIYIPSPNCVTERTTSDRYTDAAPGTTSTLTDPVSYMYYSSYVADRWGNVTAVDDSDYCVQSPIVPLTDNKTALSDAVDDFNATGSTAGHIGLAWAWYLISPNFGYLFSDDDTVAPVNPATTYSGVAYRTARTIKAVVLMTDGEFNTAYCSGVISSDIGCSPDNDNSINQANSICDQIKASGGPDHNTQLFTVGLGIGTAAVPGSTANQNAQTFLSGCSTDPSKFFYLANTAADLDDAFTSIAHSLSDLRLSK